VILSTRRLNRSRLRAVKARGQYTRRAIAWLAAYLRGYGDVAIKRRATSPTFQRALNQRGRLSNA
jgi:hypothetical protein